MSATAPLTVMDVPSAPFSPASPLGPRGPLTLTPSTASPTCAVLPAESTDAMAYTSPLASMTTSPTCTPSAGLSAEKAMSLLLFTSMFATLTLPPLAPVAPVAPLGPCGPMSVPTWFHVFAIYYSFSP